LFKRVNRTLDEKRLTDAQFLGVANAFDTIWFEGLVHKLTILHFPGSLVKTLSMYRHLQTFYMCYFHSATSPSHSMWAGVA
jgi:hypothetical protein